jgi:hypothetical protein
VRKKFGTVKRPKLERAITSDKGKNLKFLAHCFFGQVFLFLHEFKRCGVHAVAKPLT